MNQLRLLNGRFDYASTQDVVAGVKDAVQSGSRLVICTVNVAILMMMRDNSRLQAFVDNASIVVADGQPIVWASWLAGERLPERVAGVELVEKISTSAARHGHRVFLFGATQGVIDEAAKNLVELYPGLHLCGAMNGYFTDDQAAERAAQIKSSRPDILIVGMGVPRQEYFLEDYMERTGAKVAIPVGGSFDVVAKRVSRAPDWVQRIGFEWLFRLLQEPRRLWKRYVVTNSRFLLLLFLNLGRVRRSLGATAPTGTRADKHRGE